MGIRDRPFRSDKMALGIHRVATLGEDNERVLTELAGYSPADVTKLYHDGIIANQPDPEDMQI